MKALSNIMMLDLTHMLSGPYGAMILTDLGAQTIKIEPPGRGEGTRALQANDSKNSLNGMGSYFLTLNRGKKSVSLDLKSDDGLRVFYDLVRKADVVFDNFSAGVTKRLKVDHETLSGINPKIITCTITGFGETGPATKRPAYDMVAQATGGNMSITGTPESGPMRAGIPIGDLGGGVFGAVGVLAALNARTVTGRGQHVDISMLDCQISMLNYMATMHFLSGESPRGIGNAHFVHVPYNSFATKTQHIILAIITDGFYAALADLLDEPSLKKEEYKAQPARLRDQDFINGKVQEILLTDSCENWVEKMTAARIPHAPVNDFEHALNDVQVRARNMIVRVEHPEGGSIEMPGNPVKLSETHEDTFSPPPTLGQHTDEVLRQVCGKSDAEIERLRKSGAIA